MAFPPYLTTIVFERSLETVEDRRRAVSANVGDVIWSEGIPFVGFGAVMRRGANVNPFVRGACMRLDKRVENTTLTVENRIFMDLGGYRFQKMCFVAFCSGGYVICYVRKNI
mmetsp:Transcript_6773/g.8403  ORF Transcript_6773/g.8403 Transcript_6773/m.8403 type:complete len:112 (-) Transcript_6773:11-346(-)